jgi:hypothetical protein
MISFVGIVVGLLTLLIPPLFWPQQAARLSSQDFVQAYPAKKWMYYLHVGLPVIWVLLYAVILFPILWQIGDRQLYFVSFLAGGGLAVVHSIIEILTSVSMRNFSRGGPATSLVDDAVKQLGWIRLGLVLFFGLVPWVVLNFFS